ncbi:amidase [Aliikangiella coralliicola]|uniref:Amidase n=1 Tax=Aliikangiella coralliicola TaxID=2592383 RepID=A0A545U7F4_9GAMM|nr:amidase [Aliikangiella coralliicola]TQV85391.1 amidase [Aliikangiella coralliicola]
MHENNNKNNSQHTLKIFGLLVVTFLASCQYNRTTDFNTQPPVTKTGEHQQFAQMVERSNIPQLTQKMTQGQLTAVQLTQFFIDQIKMKNDQLKAVITVNPNALDVAAKLDKEREAGNVRGPLHGIPILVKDNIETREMATTAGSLALKNNHTKRDALVIANLRKAGAIILGKTNLSEWANFRSERSSSGWSAVGGQTRNPHDMARSACGSSSGSGAAVAANLAVAAIGTETDGSVVCPSSANGIVGIKPTLGLVSRAGIVPISHTQDTAGPMAKNVIDAAILLTAMRGKDSADPATQLAALNFSKNYLPESNQNFLQGKRVGILYSNLLNHEAIAKVFDKAKTQFKKLGAVFVDELKVEPYETFGKDSYDVLLYEFKHDLNQYFAGLPGELNQLTLEKLIKFNRQNADKEMLFFQQEIFEKAQEKGNLSEATYQTALTNIRKATREDGLDKLFKTHQLDLIITITGGPAWSIDRINGDHYSGGYSSYSAISGYPHLTVPMGKVHHMPIGLSFIGLSQSEDQLIAMAKTFERVIDYDPSRPPKNTE